MALGAMTRCDIMRDGSPTGEVATSVGTAEVGPHGSMPGNVGMDMTMTPTTRRRGATSRRGGEPVVLQPVLASSVQAVQMALELDLAEPGRPVREPLPGVVHVPDWLPPAAQRDL